MCKRNTTAKFTTDSATDTPVDEIADETAITSWRFFHYFEFDPADGHIGNIGDISSIYADRRDAAADNVDTDYDEPDNWFAINWNPDVYSVCSAVLKPAVECTVGLADKQCAVSGTAHFSAICSTDRVPGKCDTHSVPVFCTKHWNSYRRAVCNPVIKPAHPCTLEHAFEHAIK